MQIGGQEMKELTISELAKKSNVKISTIRYYEKRGLLGTPSRTESGYRMFSQSIIGDIKMIKHAQDLGFTLEEIKKLLSIYKIQDYFPTEEMYQFSKAKIVEIDEKIAQLNNLRALLVNALSFPISELPPPKELCPVLIKLFEGREEQ